MGHRGSSPFARTNTREGHSSTAELPALNRKIAGSSPRALTNTPRCEFRKGGGAVERAGLENRRSPERLPWVQIPPLPPDRSCPDRTAQGVAQRGPERPARTREARGSNPRTLTNLSNIGRTAGDRRLREGLSWGSPRREAPRSALSKNSALVFQLDRNAVYEAAGWRFESSRAHQFCSVEIRFTPTIPPRSFQSPMVNSTPCARGSWVP
jgi:hypothetical protein